MLEAIILLIKILGTVLIFGIAIDFLFQILFSKSLLMGNDDRMIIFIILSIVLSIFLHAPDDFWEVSPDEVENYDPYEDGRWP